MKNHKFKLPKDLVSYLSTHSKILGKRNLDTSLEGNAMGVYADDVFETLLLLLQPSIEDECGVKLIPTYSYYRRYFKGNDLKKHVDRESCEYSVTIQLGSSEPETPWEIFIDEKPYKLKIGEGVIYKGIEQEHYRKPCPMEFSSHVFLHYVNADGEYSKYAFVERESLHMGGGVA